MLFLLNYYYLQALLTRKHTVVHLYNNNNEDINFFFKLSFNAKEKKHKLMYYEMMSLL